MKIRLLAFRRMTIVCTAVIVAVGITLALGVIQPVKAEAQRGDTKPVAVQAFWANIALNVSLAAILIITAIRSEGQTWSPTPIFIIVGSVVSLLGLLLIDAASAYMDHGAAMQKVSILLYICTVADFLAGITVITTAFLRPIK